MSSPSIPVPQTRYQLKEKEDWTLNRKDKSLLAGIYSKRGNLSPGGEENTKSREQANVFRVERG
ncbi:hypothetical protein QR685DRAFT_90014 [Neurospora intermedia]|uniref:Uncharacterized protein n=1 Tax=Neurospora intermedia TaxID=5142 RepID=A0ABR3D2G8_NEUIN